MAENKRIYTIQINGLQESYDGVKNLREALDTLTDTVVNVTKQEEKNASVKKATTAATDALGKAQEKLNNWDKQYQTELAKVNSELSSNKKEINDQIKLQQAQATVEAKQLDTYRDKQTYLSALNTLIRNHTTATEADRAAIDAMVQESAALQAELKATDEQMKIYVRNVGNYPGAAQMVVESHKSLKQELKELKTEMAEMLASGVSKTDEAYLKLAERAGQLKDAMSDANQDITNFASDTRGLSNAINLASSAVNAYQLYNSALQVFGGENEEAAKSMQKMMAVMTLLNSLQQVQNSLLENGSATARLYSKAVEMIEAALGIKKAATEADIATTEAATVAEETNTAVQEANTVAQELNATANEANAASTGAATTAEVSNTGAVTANTTATQANTVATNSMSVAQKAGAVASKTLSVALRAIPLMAIIGLVMALIQNWESIWNWFKKTFPVLDTLSKKFNKFGGFMNAVVTGAKAVGAAIVNWLINPFKTFADVIGKILKGDFAGAWNAAVEGLGRQTKGTLDAFNREITKGYAKAEEERTAKAASEGNKRTKQELEELKIRERNNKTYSKKYIDLQKKDFEERKKMAKGNQEELNKIKLEEMKFDADVEDKKTKVAEAGAKARTAAAKKAAAESKKASDEAKKEYEEWVKKLNELLKEVEKDIETADKMWLTGLKNVDKVEDERQKKLIENSKEEYNIRVKSHLEHMRAIQAYLLEIKSLEHLKEVQEELYDKHQFDEYGDSFKKEAEKTREELKRVREEYSKFLDETINDKTYKDAITFVRHLNGELEGELTGRIESWRELYEKGLQLTLNDIEKFYAKRTELAVNSFAMEQVERKKDYEDQIKKLEKDEKDLQEQLAKANEEQQKKIQHDLDETTSSLNNLRKAFKAEFGEYQNAKIDIPVDLDLSYMQEQYDAAVKLFGTDLPITVNELVQARLGITDKLTKDVRTIEEVWTDAINGGEEKLTQLYQIIQTTLNLGKDETANLYELIEKKQPFKEIKIDLMEILTQGNVNLKQFGTLYTEAMQKVADLQKSMKDDLDKNYTDLISKQDKIISNNEKIIKNFQDATRDIKFEPVMENDALSKYFEGQVLNMDKTKERYDDLRRAYQEYLDSVTPGSEAMQKVEEAWQLKLETTKQKYGENSMEYRLMSDEKKKSDAAYAMEYEKVTQQIEEIDRKSARVREDYFKSLHDRMSEIYSAFNENMFQPLAEGFGALLDFQLEEAQDALDEITELYDKAVEAREKSAERMKEINEELRADDGANKEALQERLAEEEVLLVQREEAERAIEKEKKKRQYEVDLAEAKQRKFELGQKLIEGLVNTALGVTAALKYGFPMGPIFAAIIGAMGSLQTAIIAKQIGNVKMPQKYATGGKIGENGFSRSHRQGGHKVEGTNIELEGQEWVINKKSSQKYDTLLRAINDDKIGLVRKQVEIIREKRIVNSNPIVKFASGGQINTLTATRAVKENSEIQAITDLIRQIDFEPVVSVVDINRVSKNLVRVRQYAGAAG